MKRVLTGGAAVLVSIAVLAGCAATPSTSQTPAAASSPSATASGGTSADRSDTATEEANKALVSELISKTFTDPTSTSAVDAASEVIAADAVTHTSGAAAGPAGLLDQFEAAHTRVPGAQAVVKREAADGDLVAVHWQIAENPADERTGEAAVDLFRVDGGQIVEHWSFAQPIPPQQPGANTHTMFDDVYVATDGGGETAPTEQEEESNRILATDAFTSLFTDHDVSVIDRSFGTEYLQHNPAIPDGPDALRGFISSLAGNTQIPAMKSGISVADGDIVFTFSQLADAAPGDQLGGADIFRVDDGLIREHWDVVPPAPAS